MKKKTIICGVLASTIAVAATFGGCSLVSTNTAADMSQTVATVDISKADTLDKEFEAYKAAVGKTDIITPSPRNTWGLSRMNGILFL